jgi:predicted transcriptional regulator
VARKKDPGPLTPLELAIMKVLWDGSPATVESVRARLAPERDLAYTSVQTMLNVLVRKRRVERTLKDRAYRYAPVMSRKRAVAEAVGDLLDRFFSGSAESLVLSMVEERQITPRRLARLQKLLEKPHGDR